jgi:hypothetical protein
LSSGVYSEEMKRTLTIVTSERQCSLSSFDLLLDLLLKCYCGQ